MARQSYRVQFDGGSGFPLAGIIDRPDDVAQPPVVVFSHCFTCNKDLKAIVRIARHLAEAGIAVLRFDMTGLGGSDGDFAETNFSTNLADLSAAIGFAAAELGAVTGLIGHSFGGAASLYTAATDDRIQALATIAAPSDTVHLAALLANMNPAIERTGSGSVVIGGVDWTITRAMLDDLRNHDLPAQIAKIRCPTLLFHSPDDKTLSFDHPLRIMGLMQGSRHANSPASLVVVHGADHLLVDQPADLPFVAGVAAAFFDRYRPPVSHR